MPTVHFTSDLHLGHRKVAGIRGFDSTEAHDAALADRWAAQVAPDDVVWVLGDIAASSPLYALSQLAEWPGEKHLILGNHEKAHPYHRDAHKHLRTYLDVFESVASMARRRVYGTEVLLSHFPYDRDRHEPRYTQWRLRNEGKWLLHGHTHGTERVTYGYESKIIAVNPETYAFQYRYTHAREIHVGVDAWDLTPVSLDTVADLIEEHSPR